MLLSTPTKKHDCFPTRILTVRQRLTNSTLASDESESREAVGEQRRPSQYAKCVKRASSERRWPSWEMTRNTAGARGRAPRQQWRLRPKRGQREREREKGRKGGGLHAHPFQSLREGEGKAVIENLGRGCLRCLFVHARMRLDHLLSELWTIDCSRSLVSRGAIIVLSDKGQDHYLSNLKGIYFG